MNGGRGPLAGGPAAHCRQVRPALGVYVLGAIDPAERAAVEAHLADCPACRDELAALAGLPALLGRVSEEQIEAQVAAADPAPGLLERVLVEAARDRGRQRRRRLAVAAAVVALGVGLGAAGGRLLADSAEPAGRAPVAAPTPTLSAHAAQVRAAVGLVPRSWGTEVSVRLSGVAPGTRCALVAVDRSGHREVAASWQVAYEGEATFPGATAIPRTELTHFDIVTAQGRKLLSIPVD